MSLARIIIQRDYKGSDLGWLWAFAQPIVYVLAFYLAISIGFKSAKDIDGIVTPYFIWLVSGLMAWFYMRDMFTGGPAIFSKYRQLIGKTAFPISTIPVAAALSKFWVHMIVMAGVLVLTICCGCAPSIYWIQLPFYMLMMMLFAAVWSLGAGLLTLLSRDFYNLIKAIKPVFFWLSGILFNINADRITDGMQVFFMLNPFSYIVEGYRNTICYHVWFFEEWQKLLCYLGILFIFTLIMLWLYKKLRKSVPDIV